MGIEGPNSNGISRLSYKVRRKQVVRIEGPNSIRRANAHMVYKGRKLAFHTTKLKSDLGSPSPLIQFLRL